MAKIHDLFNNETFFLVDNTSECYIYEWEKVLCSLPQLLEYLLYSRCSINTCCQNTLAESEKSREKAERRWECSLYYRKIFMRPPTGSPLHLLQPNRKPLDKYLPVPPEEAL
jgi:hypothetical protein